MKRNIVCIGLIILTLTSSACRFTQPCATYSNADKKKKLKESERLQKHLAKRVYKPGMFY